MGAQSFLAILGGGLLGIVGAGEPEGGEPDGGKTGTNQRSGFMMPSGITPVVQTTIATNQTRSLDHLHLDGLVSFRPADVRGTLGSTPEVYAALHEATPESEYRAAVIAALARGLRHHGFFQATVKEIPSPDLRSPNRGFTVRVDEGPRTVWGELSVEGADPAVNRVIREGLLANDPTDRESEDDDDDAKPIWRPTAHPPGDVMKQFEMTQRITERLRDFGVDTRSCQVDAHIDTSEHTFSVRVRVPADATAKTPAKVIAADTTAALPPEGPLGEMTSRLRQVYADNFVGLTAGFSVHTNWYFGPFAAAVSDQGIARESRDESNLQFHFADDFLRFEIMGDNGVGEIHVMAEHERCSIKVLPSTKMWTIHLPLPSFHFQLCGPTEGDDGKTIRLNFHGSTTNLLDGVAAENGVRITPLGWQHLFDPAATIMEPTSSAHSWRFICGENEMTVDAGGRVTHLKQRDHQGRPFELRRMSPADQERIRGQWNVDLDPMGDLVDPRFLATLRQSRRHHRPGDKSLNQDGSSLETFFIPMLHGQSELWAKLALAFASDYGLDDPESPLGQLLGLFVLQQISDTSTFSARLLELEPIIDQRPLVACAAAHLAWKSRYHREAIHCAHAALSGANDPAALAAEMDWLFDEVPAAGRLGATVDIHEFATLAAELAGWAPVTWQGPLRAAPEWFPRPVGDDAIQRDEVRSANTRQLLNMTARTLGRSLIESVAAGVTQKAGAKLAKLDARRDKVTGTEKEKTDGEPDEAVPASIGSRLHP